MPEYDSEVARALCFLAEQFKTPNETNSDYEDANIVDVMAKISRALIALGNNEAATNMGAIEAHGKAVMDGCELIANSIDTLAAAVRGVDFFNPPS